MRYAELEIDTTCSFFEAFFENVNDYIFDNMPTIIIQHELQGDYGYFEGQMAWSEIHIESIEIVNKSDYTAEQLELIKKVIDEQWDTFPKGFENELMQNWNNFTNPYY